jgi:hypothetical protein
MDGSILRLCSVADFSTHISGVKFSVSAALELGDSTVFTIDLSVHLYTANHRLYFVSY